MKKNPLRSILVTAFLTFAHHSLILYINSTVLSSFVGTNYTSLFYVLAATGSIVLLFCLPRIVKRAGLLPTTTGIFLLIALCCLVLGTTTNAYTFAPVFVLYMTLSGTVWYCNDLFVSHYAESKTAGHTRGTYLTVINTAVALMPIVTGFLVLHGGFKSVYIAGASLLFIATGILVQGQRDFVDKPYASATISDAWQVIKQSPSLRRVLSINFILQFFYVWMTVFTPLYMSKILGFSWTQIGLAFSLMLTAFILLQYAVGKWADSIGEKKLLIAGFLIAAVSTIIFALSKSDAILYYAAILFMTRVGICMVEVLSETYFFKQITDSDEGVVSVFRMMYPLAYIIAPLLGLAIIATTSYTILFVSLGAVLLFGAAYATRLVDIR